MPRYPPGYELMPSSRPVGDAPLALPEATLEGEGERGEGGEAGVVEEEGWVRLERAGSGGEEGAQREGGQAVEESGLLGDNIMVGEVDMNAKGWQIVSNTVSKLVSRERGGVRSKV